jgi:ComF family protein
MGIDSAWLGPVSGRRRCGVWSAGRAACFHGGSALANLLFPPVCGLCGAELQPRGCGDPLLCDGCRDQFSVVGRHACPHCASPLPLLWSRADDCPRCHSRKYRFRYAIALGEYRGAVRQAVVSMKRAAYEPLTHSLGGLLGQAVAVRLSCESLQMVVPVPMHWWRRFRRGTNTARHLAAAVARQLQLPVVPNLLVCQRRTRKQGTLLPRQRTQNVRNAFRLSTGYDITDTKILLVDDVMTTGATLNEAARILRRAGASEVDVAVVARGIGRQ